MDTHSETLNVNGLFDYPTMEGELSSLLIHQLSASMEDLRVIVTIFSSLMVLKVVPAPCERCAGMIILKPSLQPHHNQK